MMKHRATRGSLALLAYLALGVAGAHAQDLKAAMQRRAAEEQRPNKPKDDGAKPGPKPEQRPGSPGFGPGARPYPGAPGSGPGGHPHMGDNGPNMHERMDHRPGMGPHQGMDASVPRGPRGFAMMGDAGIRHPRRPNMTPEQLAKRNEHLAKLRANWGKEVLQRREVKIELGMHAWRIARLERIRTLALEQKKTKVVEKVDALIKKENERHQQRLERLRSGRSLVDAGVAPGPKAPQLVQPKPDQPKTGGQP
jgi:hypothetical protein